MAYLLGIDAGLTVTKAALFDETGACISVARRQVPQVLPLPRHVEREMEALWVATCSAIREVLAKSCVRPEQVLGVSQTAHGDGLYLLDKSGAPLGRGILSLDSRAAQIVAGWENDGRSDEVLTLAGQRPHVSSPAALLSWLKTYDPNRYDQIGHIISCKDWLSYRLTNKVTTDRTEASSAFTNVETQIYDLSILDVYELNEIGSALPTVHHSAEPVGTISQRASKATGLVVGTPVAAGLHDVTASALGMDAHRQETYALVAGTYSINQAVSDRASKDARWFCRNAIEPGLWNNMAISPASTTNYDWFVRTFCAFEASHLEACGRSIHAVLSEEMQAIENEVPIFHPFLFGSPFGAEASGAFLGLRGWQDRGAIVAGLLEGIVFNHKHHIDDLDQVFSASDIRVSGGVIRNPLVPQLFADALGRIVSVPDVDEAAAKGAAACAGVAAGIFADVSEAVSAFVPDVQSFHPNLERHDVLTERYAVYCAAAESMKPVWPSLNGMSDQ